MIKVFCWLTASLLMSLPIVGQEVVPITPELAGDYGLDEDFYSKATLAEGILIVSSSEVSDFAHLETAYLLSHLMQAQKRR